MRRHQIKRETDLQIISDWIEPRSRVLDLGCGRGLLLEHLRDQKEVHGVGVDLDAQKVQGCVKRGINVFQGDAMEFLREIPNGFYDWVILSRMLQELAEPDVVITEALRAGRRLAVGFVNFGFWRNRLAQLVTGNRIINDVFPHPWYLSRPANTVTIRDFEDYCRIRGFRVDRKTYLRGNWLDACHRFPNWLAGYAVYQLASSRALP